MKNFCYIILFFAMLSLSSCFEVDEQYDFKANGSVDFTYSLDLGPTVATLVGMMPDSARKKDPQFNNVVDTTLNFYTASPEATRKKMNPEQANLAKNSNINVKMNLNKNIMKVSIAHSAKSAAGLEYFFHNLSKIPSLDKPLKQITKDNGKSNDTTGARQLMEYEDYCVYEITPHKFYRTIDTAKYGAFSRKNKQTVEAAKSMKILIPYKVTLNFASPVKNVTSSIAKVSADRKKVTIETDMETMNKNPSIINLKVDY